MFSDSEYILMLVIISLITYISRLTFVLYTPKLVSKEVVKTGLDGLSPSMLVGFVIPFTLFVNKRLDLFRFEVLAIFLALMIVVISKKPSLGILAAMSIYLTLSYIF